MFGMFNRLIQVFLDPIYLCLDKIQQIRKYTHINKIKYFLNWQCGGNLYTEKYNFQKIQLNT